MNILHLSSERGWRGGEQQIAYLIEESTDMGVNCHVISRKGSKFEEFCISKKITNQPASFKNQFDLTSASAIKRYCKEHKIDLIHAHSSHSHALAVLSSVMGNRTPVILSRRVDFLPKNKWLTRFKYEHHSIKKIICVSHAIEDILITYGLQKKLLCTVHSGVDLARFKDLERSNLLRKELNITPDEVLVGNISALADHKDYPTFLHTAKSLQSQSNIKFVIIGSGELEDDLKALAKQLNLDNVLFTGFRNDVPHIFKDLDIFLMTSKTEGLGTTVLDAFANNIPVVATDAGGISEMVRNRTTGVLCEIGDSEALAKGVLEVSTNEVFKNLIVENASRSLEAFKKEKTAQRTVSIYNDVLATL